MGWSQRAIADALGVSEAAVSQWFHAVAERGRDALLTHAQPGAPPKLTAAQKRWIPEFLWHGPEAYGFRGEVWTCARIAKVIEVEFGVRYHRDHVGRLLADLQWTPQVPVRRATQRDEHAIERWRTETWPTLQEQAHTQRRTLIFVDESGFYLLPGLVRTYAPKSHTPVIRAKQTRAHLSVMGGMTSDGKVYTLVRRKPLTGIHSLRFLQHLLCVVGGRLLVIWDGSSIHRRTELTKFLSTHRAAIRVESLPAYAPDLNPWDEGGWHHLKNVEMRNLVCRDLEELHYEFHLAVGRFRQKPHLLRACYAQAGLRINTP